MKIALIIVAVVVVIAVLIYNSLVQSRVRVDNAWAQIDVQLQRRLDLIGNLVETVKGYAAHERQTLEAVISARAKAVSAASPEESSAAQGVLGAALGRLLAVAEAYPDLKANVNFLSLQEELANTESRIAYARNYYNESVQGFNTKISTIPYNFVAGFMSLTPRGFYQGDEAARQAPKVQF